MNGSLGNYPDTKEGTNVTFWCNGGFVPSAINTAMCNGSGMWSPNPALHYCEFVTGNNVTCIIDSVQRVYSMWLIICETMEDRGSL